jgi:hypothetical protein
MCAIYTAIPPPSPEELSALARVNETAQYRSHRKTLGRRAMLELVALVAPPSRKELANLILERDLWAFLTPAASRGNHAAALAKAHDDIAIPFPLWPESTLLACLTGAAPAHYAHYIGNNLAMLQTDLVPKAVAAFQPYESNELVGFLLEFLGDAAKRGDCVLLHWDHR